MGVCICAVSGGLDSYVMCWHYYNMGYHVVPVYFKYGSTHMDKEFEVAKLLYPHGILVRSINLPYSRDDSISSLLREGGGSPVVPGSPL